MKYLRASVALIGCIPTLSFAFFCPTNFKQIDYGNTMDQVIAQCGAPTTKQESKRPNENVPQTWTYYLPFTGSGYGGIGGITGIAPMSQPQGAPKTEITFNSEGNAVNISTNGVSVGMTFLCNTSIQVGAKKDNVKTACGEPTSVKKEDAPPGSTVPSNEAIITTFIYSTTPPIKLIFENGLLRERQ